MKYMKKKYMKYMYEKPCDGMCEQSVVLYMVNKDSDEQANMWIWIINRGLKLLIFNLH